MAKKPTATEDLNSIIAERTRIETLLAEIVEKEKAAREVERDAGRAPLMTALDKVKIAPMSSSDARTIARSIAQLGGSKVAELVGASAA